MVLDIVMLNVHMTSSSFLDRAMLMGGSHQAMIQMLVQENMAHAVLKWISGKPIKLLKLLHLILALLINQQDAIVTNLVEPNLTREKDLVTKMAVI